MPMNRYHDEMHASMLMPNLVPHTAEANFTLIKNEFIPHPRDFPFTIRRLPRWPQLFRRQRAPSADVGLRFRHDAYLPTGTRIEVTIPLRGALQKFNGTVVLVREIWRGYELGLWLDDVETGVRARLVEQICHLEATLDRQRRKPNQRQAAPSRRPPLSSHFTPRPVH